MNHDESLELARERTVLANERTKLASERNFLAWIRTGLTCVGGGIAIIRFLPFQHLTHQFLGKIAGECLMIMGIVVFLIAFINHKEAREKAFWPMVLITASLTIISTILLLIT